MEESSSWSSRRVRSALKLQDGEDESFSLGACPPGKRLTPVGADDDKGEMKIHEGSHDDDLATKVKELEKDQEELNNSLMSMTSHFAKVQLRLQQVVNAPADQREELLIDLQHFAFRAIPDVKPATKAEEEVFPDDVADEALSIQREKHARLIHQLKGQLEELEGYAYASGDGEMPSNVLLERQRVVIEQLKQRLNLNVDNIDKLTEDELKAEVDEAVGQLVTPLKMKSHLINQLKTQIEDLEMFIELLQAESSSTFPGECTDCECKKHKNLSPSKLKRRTKSEQEEIRKQTVSILERTMAVLQLATVSQFGCGGKFGCGRARFYRNSLKKTTQGNHFGDLRANLELAIDHVLEACSKIECMTDTDLATSESDSQTEMLMTSPEVSSLVRKELAAAIRDLMHHGLVTGPGKSTLMPLLGCMSGRSNSSGQGLTHAWDIIIKFYEMKLGHEYNSAPARKLSQSFGLDLSGSSSSNKQSLLTMIGKIIQTHSPYKRSSDAKFKAFVSAGLNQKKLIPWLKLIIRNQSILEYFYSPWSYVAKTGFDDGFKALERLTIYNFYLPVDVAVKQFQQINEAF